MRPKSKYNCAFCLTPISPGHWETQNGKCQSCNYYFPDAMPFQNICTEFGCTEVSKMGEVFCMEHLTDKRYSTPKLMQPKANDEAVAKAIEENPFYREVSALLKDDESKNAQRRQVAYGLDKYPETLNGDSWSPLEALDHLQSELVDALHYISLLKDKFKKESEKVET